MLTHLCKLLLGATTVFAGCLVAGPVAQVSADQMPEAPCYNGITPLNPYVNNCALTQRPPRVMGSAPDQTALLNCGVGSQGLRTICLSQYVNGGNYYPGVIPAHP